MESLYTIEAELSAIFEELEDNGGEFTEDIEKRLTITEEKFKEKVNSYCEAISIFNEFVNNAKCEKKRINELQKSRENIVEKLKNRILYAVLAYGKEGKTGNKTCELPTRKLYTKTTKSIEIVEDRVNNLLNAIRDVIKEHAFILDSNPEHLVKIINDNRTKYGLEADYTIDDIKNLKFTVTKQFTFEELLQNYGLVQDINKEEMIPSRYEFNAVIDSKDLLSRINTGEKLSIAYPVEKQAIIIK